MKSKIFILILLCFFLSPTTGHTDTGEDSLAYKLALIHVRSLNPEDFLVKKNIQPPRATISEFEWILQSLESRCSNPDTALADTMVETWKAMTQKGSTMTLLDVARELSSAARSTTLFGNQKVNFRVTSKVWLTSKLTNKSMQQIVQFMREQ